MGCRYIIFDLDNTLYPKETGLLNEINRQIDCCNKIRATSTKIKEKRLDYCNKYGIILGGMVVREHIDLKNPLILYIKLKWRIFQNKTS